VLNLRNHCVCLDLDAPLGIDEARHLHDGVRRSNVTEDLSMGARDGLPIFDAGEQDPRTDDW
jgi:hypothetical protein